MTSETIRSLRQGRLSSPAAMAASGSAWRADWRKPAPLSRSSGAMRRSRTPRSPSSRQRGVKAISVVADVTDKTGGRRHGRARRHANSAGSISSSTTPASTSAKPPHGCSTRRMGQRHQDQPHQRVPVLAGGLPGDEGRGRRQDHQHRLDDVDLRRQLCAGLRREQGRHRPVHAAPARWPGPPTTSRSTRCCRAGSTPT